MIRSFIAITLPEEITKAISNVQSEVEKIKIPNLNFVPLENLHITILFLGDKTKEDIDHIIDNIPDLGKIKEKVFFHNPYLGFFGRRVNPSVLYMGFEDTHGYGNILASEISRTINQTPDKLWNPHITFGRFRKGKSNFKSYSLESLILPEIGFSPAKIVLFANNLGSSGPKYTPLHEF